MHIITVRNVNYALPEGVQLIKRCGKPVSPRGQATLEVPEPVTTVYENPWERALFSDERDANPFLHLFEALWLLAGRQDVEFVAQFNARMASYSDDGETFHAAYGYRLRHHFGLDQLRVVLDKLRNDPTTRQAVLQIWSAKDDLGVETKDMPCNDTIALKLRNGALHMTVFCRSNDFSWGAYGTNVVQFSMLLEYLAAHLGVAMGQYTQVSDSFHAYIERDDWQRIKDLPLLAGCPYASGHVHSYPLVDVPNRFDAELAAFLNDPLDDLGEMFVKDRRNSFLWAVAQPMYRAWQAHKQNKNGAQYLLACEATDWRHAGIKWLDRRGDRLTPKQQEVAYAGI